MADGVRIYNQETMSHVGMASIREIITSDGFMGCHCYDDVSTDQTVLEVYHRRKRNGMVFLRPKDSTSDIISSFLRESAERNVVIETPTYGTVKLDLNRTLHYFRFINGLHLFISIDNISSEFMEYIEVVPMLRNILEKQENVVVYGDRTIPHFYQFLKRYANSVLIEVVAKNKVGRAVNKLIQTSDASAFEELVSRLSTVAGKGNLRRYVVNVISIANGTVVTAKKLSFKGASLASVTVFYDITIPEQE